LKRYCGRDFSEKELIWIRTLIAEDSRRTRADLSRLFCQAMHWLKPDGGLKDMSCRVAMLRMLDDGLIQLPPPRSQRPQSCLRISVETDPEEPIQLPVHALPNLQLRLVGARADSRLWNEYIHRYHYLGFKTHPVHNCFIGSGPGAAWSLFWALASPLGSVLRVTNSSVGPLSSAKRTSILSSTMPVSDPALGRLEKPRFQSFRASG